MNDPFTPHLGGNFGFGFDPEQRRALHEQRRHARREFREHIREHGTDRHGPFGPGFQAGFGGSDPAAVGFGFDPRGGFGFGGPRGRRGGGRRGKRGDVRAAILALLADRADARLRDDPGDLRTQRRPVASQPRLGLPDAATAGRRGPHRRAPKAKAASGFSS